jgi:carboxypeptidase family protein
MRTIGKYACFLLVSAAAAICAGQGAISGKILTAAGKGAPVPSAPVGAKNPDTKMEFKATSTADGSYELSGLSAGTYEISVENVPLFLPFHQRDVRVEAGKTTKLDIRLDDFNLNTLGDGGEQFVEILEDKPAPSGPAPRASDGKPDLSGVWGPTLPKLVGDPPQPLPWAEAAAKQRFKLERITDLGPGACLPGGISFGPSQRLVQTPSLIVMIDGGFNPPRQIYLDGRAHPQEFNPSWMGHSIGHWDGDTLVVDTVGFNDLGWVGVGPGLPAFPQTGKLHLTERYRRLDLGHLEVETTYEDPSEFKKPFTMRQVSTLAPKDEEVLEYVCAENNRDLPHLLAPGRERKP